MTKDRTKLQTVETTPIESQADTVKKPAKGFYEAVRQDVMRLHPDVQSWVPIGDSLRHDVIPYFEWPTPHGYWLRRAGDTPSPEHEGVGVIASLAELVA